jgi:hypothetical protein
MVVLAAICGFIVGAIAGAIILAWIVVHGRAKSPSNPPQAGGAS